MTVGDRDVLVTAAGAVQCWGAPRLPALGPVAHVAQLIVANLMLVPGLKRASSAGLRSEGAGSGLVLVWKRLEQGAFKWPPITDGVMRLSPAQLAALVEGLDWSRVHVPRIARPKATR